MPVHKVEMETPIKLNIVCADQVCSLKLNPCNRRVDVCVDVCNHPGSVTTNITRYRGFQQTRPLLTSQLASTNNDIHISSRHSLHESATLGTTDCSSRSAKNTHSAPHPPDGERWYKTRRAKGTLNAASRLFVLRSVGTTCGARLMMAQLGACSRGECASSCLRGRGAVARSMER